MDPEFLKNISKKGPFMVPEGYFETLNSEIGGKLQEENKQFAFRAAAEGTIFEVPTAYFDSLPARIAARTGSAEQPLASMTGRAADRQPAHLRPDYYFKMAAAACVVLIMSIVGVMQVEEKSDPANFIMTVADFDEELLVHEYLESVSPEEESQPGDLETYLLNQVDENLLLQEL